MFSFETFLESRYVALRFRGCVAVHFIGTAATSERAWTALRFQALPTLPDFLLKLSFVDNIRSVSFCHPLSLPQLSVLEQCSFRRPSRHTDVLLRFCMLVAALETAMSMRAAIQKAHFLHCREDSAENQITN